MKSVKEPLKIDLVVVVRFSRDPRAVLAHHRKAIFQTPPVLISEIEAQLRAVGPYRTITIYEAPQLRCLVVMLLREELGKGCLGRICQISRKVKQGTLPLSLEYDLQIKKEKLKPKHQFGYAISG